MVCHLSYLILSYLVLPTCSRVTNGVKPRRTMPMLNGRVARLVLVTAALRSSIAIQSCFPQFEGFNRSVFSAAGRLKPGKLPFASLAPNTVSVDRSGLTSPAPLELLAQVNAEDAAASSETKRNEHQPAERYQRARRWGQQRADHLLLWQELVPVHQAAHATDSRLGRARPQELAARPRRQACTGCWLGIRLVQPGLPEIGRGGGGVLRLRQVQRRRHNAPA